MTGGTSCCGLRPGSVIMETELTSRGRGFGFGGMFGYPARLRPARVQASGLYSVADDFHVFLFVSYSDFFIFCCGY